MLQFLPRVLTRALTPSKEETTDDASPDLEDALDGVMDAVYYAEENDWEDLSHVLNRAYQEIGLRAPRDDWDYFNETVEEAYYIDPRTLEDSIVALLRAKRKVKHSDLELTEEINEVQRELENIRGEKGTSLAPEYGGDE